MNFRRGKNNQRFPNLPRTLKFWPKQTQIYQRNLLEERTERIPLELPSD